MPAVWKTLPQTLFDTPNVSVFYLLDTYFLTFTNCLLWDCKQVWFSFILKNKKNTILLALPILKVIIESNLNFPPNF